MGKLAVFTTQNSSQVTLSTETSKVTRHQLRTLLDVPVVLGLSWSESLDRLEELDSVTVENLELKLPGGYDDGSQMGLIIHFSGNGDLDALKESLTAEPWLLGCYVRSSDSEPFGYTLFTLGAMQAPLALQLIMDRGFSIKEMRPNIIPTTRYALILLGAKTDGRVPPELRAALRRTEAIPYL